MEIALLVLIAFVAGGQCASIEEFEVTEYSSEDDDVESPGCGWGCNRVAFMAYLSGCKNLGEGQHVKYDSIILNDKHNKKGYDPKTGVFTAPYSGVYSFTFSVESNMKEASVNLIVDGKTTASAIAQVKPGPCKCDHHHHHHHDHDHCCCCKHQMATNTAVVHVCEGKTVYVATAAACRVGGCGEHRYTAFSGHLLYKRK